MGRDTVLYTRLFQVLSNFTLKTGRHGAGTASNTSGYKPQGAKVCCLCPSGNVLLCLGLQLRSRASYPFWSSQCISTLSEGQAGKPWGDHTGPQPMPMSLLAQLGTDLPWLQGQFEEFALLVSPILCDLLQRQSIMNQSRDKSS